MNANSIARRSEGNYRHPLYASPHSEDEAIPLDKIQLAPFGVLVAKVQ